MARVVMPTTVLPVEDSPLRGGTSISQRCSWRIVRKNGSGRGFPPFSAISACWAAGRRAWVISFSNTSAAPERQTTLMRSPNGTESQR